MSRYVRKGASVIVGNGENGLNFFDSLLLLHMGLSEPFQNLGLLLLKFTGFTVFRTDSEDLVGEFFLLLLRGVLPSLHQDAIGSGTDPLLLPYNFNTLPLLIL